MRVAFRILPYVYLLLALLPLLSMGMVLWNLFSAYQAHDEDIIDPLSLVPPVIFLTIGIAFFAVFITNAVLLFRRSHWKLSLILSSLACLGFPFGTGIGVVSIFVLTRPEIRARYPLP